MEMIDMGLPPDGIGTILISLLAVSVISVFAVGLLKGLARIKPSAVPAWVWTGLIFLLVGTTHYLLSRLFHP